MRAREIYFSSLLIVGVSFSGCGTTSVDEKASLDTISEEQIKLIKTPNESIDLHSVNLFQENLKKGE